MAAERGLKVLFVTANVGSVFSKPSLLMPIWFEELITKVESVRPDFFALHCQEVGGKSQGAVQPREVDDFIDKLTARLRERSYDRSLCVVDTDSRNDQRYTALGSFYFVRKSPFFDISSWNFYERRFEPLRTGEAHVYSGCIDDVQYAQKERFTPDLYPLCRWSRKGFMHTRWQFRAVGADRLANHSDNGCTDSDGANEQPNSGDVTLELDLVNVHLFHDVCNLVALERSPSVYSQYRANGLRYALNRCRDAIANRPLFVFGDFNFRLDTHALLEQLTKLHQLVAEPTTSGSPTHDSSATKRMTTMRYRRKNDDTKPLLEVAEKRFKLLETDNLLRPQTESLTHNPTLIHTSHADSLDNKPSSIDSSTDGKSSLAPESNVSVSLMRPFDGEPHAFEDSLFELPISFAPTYPLSEKTEEPGSYMPTRCPSWCDRVLLTQSAADLIAPNLSRTDFDQRHALLCEAQTQYDILGRLACTGDHKPVFLAATLKS